MSEEAFLADVKTQWAVYSQIVLIGEAAGRVSVGFCNAHPELPWKEMTGMRHRLVHGYDDINWSRVWQSVQDDLPTLVSIVGGLLT